MYPEQSYGGQKHAVTEPSVSLRSAAGSDSDENCRPPSSHGKRPVSVLCFMFVDIRFIYYWGKVVMNFFYLQSATVLRFMSISFPTFPSLVFCIFFKQGINTYMYCDTCTCRVVSKNLSRRKILKSRRGLWVKLIAWLCLKCNNRQVIM